MSGCAARRVGNPDEFARLIEPLLSADPVRWTVLAVSVERARRGAAPDDALLFVVEDDAGAVVAAGQHWPPYGVGLHGAGAEVGDAAGTAAAALVLSLGRTPHGVVGRREAAYGFVRAWREATGDGARLTRSMRLHRLGSLVPPRGVVGTSRPASEADVPLVGEWMDRFQADIDQVTTRGEDWARERWPRVVVWEAAAAPVAMAASTPPAAGVSRVGPVYTPPGSRSHGFGTAVTAAATQAAIDGGASGACLYTDLANPVSNSIYAKIGYVPVADEVELTFGTAPG